MKKLRCGRVKRLVCTHTNVGAWQKLTNPSILTPVPVNLYQALLPAPSFHVADTEISNASVSCEHCPLPLPLCFIGHEASSVIACLSNGLKRLQFICLVWLGGRPCKVTQGYYQETYLFTYFYSVIHRCRISSSVPLPHKCTMAATLPGLSSTFGEGVDEGASSSGVQQILESLWLFIHGAITSP